MCECFRLLQCCWGMCECEEMCFDIMSMKERWPVMFEMRYDGMRSVQTCHVIVYFKDTNNETRA